ncbi:MAG: bifunctional 5,10-methylenetetrahydrofolate dehydrogenase/5,10-methenyltetrahydrofolate cyclohydrolase [Synergistaceae bacterium]|nr:bifunctional 5,10-methylenetetrahydrofolate dehydrogenase/5,10-methenyltetrahydrofolate cyclohydrolase [Synergistaceae bacterium]
MKGAEVVAKLNAAIKEEVRLLRARNILPGLAIVRVGEREGDIAYQRGATKRCSSLGVEVKSLVLPTTVTQEEVLHVVDSLNEDASIHGVLLLRPLPKHIDDEVIRNRLLPAKDVDGITDASIAAVFTGSINVGFPPCTPQACVKILDHYGVDLKGKRVVVVGRSLVVGRPVAMMLLGKNATVTVCHSGTKNMSALCREADVLVVAIGKARMIDQDYFSPGQMVIDVGINEDENGVLCGDVNFTDAEKIVDAVTPVPGGVGSVTTTLLAEHVTQAAKCIGGRGA